MSEQTEAPEPASIETLIQRWHDTPPALRGHTLSALRERAMHSAAFLTAHEKHKERDARIPAIAVMGADEEVHAELIRAEMETTILAMVLLTRIAEYNGTEHIDPDPS